MSKISNGTILDLAGVTPGGPTVLYRAVVQTFAAWMETTRDAVKEPPKHFIFMAK